MKLKKLATAFLAGLTFLGVTLTSAPKALAASSSNTHTLNSAYVVYGAGTSQEARQNLAKVFETDSSFKTLTATGNDRPHRIATSADSRLQQIYRQWLEQYD